MCPLKGLTIMNAYHSHFPDFERDAFPSPTGVNYYQLITLGTTLTVTSTSFRPQQGLTIMNWNFKSSEYYRCEFPSPTGVNYYE